MPIIFLGCFIQVKGQQPGSPTVVPPFVRDSLDNYVARAMKAWQLPGLALAVVKDGQVVYMKGYGVRSLRSRQPVDENTLFMIGSNTKAFTATVLTNLAYEGKLSLEDRVTKWMPGFKLSDPFATEDIRVRDLLGHHIGVQTFQGDFTYWTSNLSRSEVIRHFGRIPLTYPFRTRYGYCNAAFVTAGQLVPLITDTPWETEVKRMILQPLQMNRTLTLSKELLTAENVARPYSFNADDSLIQIPYNMIDNLAPAGSMSSSVRDLSHWVIMQLDSGRYDGRQVIPFPVIRSTRRPQTIVGHSHYLFNGGYYTMYGSGWFLDEYAGRELVYHTGGVNGFLTSVTLVPGERLGIIVLTNSDENLLFQALKMELLDAYLGLPERDYSDRYLSGFRKHLEQKEGLFEREMDTVNRHPGTAMPLNAYRGSYHNPVYGGINIRVEEGNLNIHFSHHPQLIGKLLPLGGNAFLCLYSDPEMGEKRVEFSIRQAKVRSLILRVYSEVENTPYDFTKD